MIFNILSFPLSYSYDDVYYQQKHGFETKAARPLTAEIRRPGTEQKVSRLARPRTSRAISIAFPRKKLANLFALS